MVKLKELVYKSYLKKKNGTVAVYRPATSDRGFKTRTVPGISHNIESIIQ